ncbi:MAG TPA: hypothetical protein VGX46_10175 [Vicinamibacterales bacterium]|nr:hypothetical protein [Vicinamibacterales bacterium]
MNEYKVNCRRSLDVLETRLTKHLQPFFAGRRMSTITSADVRTYVTHRLATPIVTGKGDAETSLPVSNAENNRELTTLKRAFTLAVQGGKLLHQPHIPMLKENNVRFSKLAPSLAANYSDLSTMSGSTVVARCAGT